MRLLSPSEHKQAVRREDDRRLRERADYEAETARLIHSYHSTKRDIEVQVEEMRAWADAERKREQESVKELRNQVVRLSDERKELLRPIDGIRFEAERLLDDAKTKQEVVMTERRSLESEKVLLRDRATTVENDALGVRVARERLQYDEKRIEKECAEWERQKQDEEIALTERKEVVETSERTLQDKEDVIARRETEIAGARGIIERRQSKLNLLQERINSERAALEAVYAEARKKGLI